MNFTDQSTCKNDISPCTTALCNILNIVELRSRCQLELRTHILTQQVSGLDQGSSSVKFPAHGQLAFDDTVGCVQAPPATSKPEAPQPSQAAAAPTSQASVPAPTQAAASTAAPLPAPVATPPPTATPFAAGGPVAESPHAPSAPAAPPMPPSQPPQVTSLDPLNLLDAQEVLEMHSSSSAFHMLQDFHSPAVVCTTVLTSICIASVLAIVIA